ncbi:hypothetical protein ACHAXA_006934 [Cyclostephanos tholiformis]|uniref:Uncharacterized protein n=1 Tax=Cyclostephanos tholiformis TaxID=382380 RepID=A0ABD3RRT4_9STRA
MGRAYTVVVCGGLLWVALAVVAPAAAAAAVESMASINDVVALAPFDRSTTIDDGDDDDDDDDSDDYECDYYDEEEDDSSDHHRDRDPFVVASPPSVAAVCRDGIAMVSFHYDVDRPEGDEIDNEEEGKEVGCGDADGGDAATTVTISSIAAAVCDDGGGSSEAASLSTATAAVAMDIARRFRDLPSSTRGPLRIESIHDDPIRHSRVPPMSLLTAGWRTDGMALSDAARALVSDEVRLFCPPSSMSSSSSSPSSSSAMAMGKRIALGLSYYLTRCASSAAGGGGVRSLSCVGLLACGGGGGGGGGVVGGEGGTLHLIDALGAYRVRAHAIGSGMDALNRRMAYVDFGSMDCECGLRAILRIVAEVEEGGGVGGRGVGGGSRGGGDEDDNKNDESAMMGGGLTVAVNPGDDEDGYEQRQLLRIRERRPTSGTVDPSRQKRKLSMALTRQDVVVELAVLRTGEGRMRRVRLSSLFRPPSLTGGSRSGG